MNARHKQKLAAGRESGRMLERYLTAIDRALNTGHVQIGRVEGFPTSTTDPDVIDKLARHYIVLAEAAPSKVKELAHRSRAGKLYATADRMRNSEWDEEAESWFIEMGKEYCDSKGYTYAALRDMGVPAGTLKEAGW